MHIIRDKPVLSLLGGAVLIILGLLISDIPRMIASQGWPTVEGTIVSRRFVGQKFKEYDGDYYINIDGYIRYQYTVNGIPYSSVSVSSIDSPFYPYSIAVRYPVGTDVTVHYNPNKPSEAVLEPGFIPGMRVLDFDSYLAAGAGIYFLVLSSLELLKRKRRNKLVQDNDLYPTGDSR